MFPKLGDIRRVIQIAVLALCNSYLSVFSTRHIYQGPLKSICLPFIYCHSCPSATFACPMGTLQHYGVIHKIPYFLLGHIGLIGLLVGRMACGWLCPFGLIQDLLFKLKSRKVTISHRYAGLRYGVLAVFVVLLPYFLAETWFSKICPFGTIVAAIPWLAWDPADPTTGHSYLPGGFGVLFVSKVAILLGFLALFVLSKRPFCRFACPMGLVYSWFNRVSLLELRVAPECDRCNACQKVCPVDLKVYEDPNSPHCVRCLQCTECRHVTVAVPMLGLRTGVSDDLVQIRRKDAPSPAPSEGEV